jgi:hypothetical protein
MPAIQSAPIQIAGARVVDPIRALPPGSFARPSSVAGKNYDRVSRSYFIAVHSVLKGEKTAAEALASVEKDLSQIPGLRLPRRRTTNKASGQSNVPKPRVVVAVR